MVEELLQKEKASRTSEQEFGHANDSLDDVHGEVGGGRLLEGVGDDEESLALVELLLTGLGTTEKFGDQGKEGGAGRRMSGGDGDSYQMSTSTGDPSFWGRSSWEKRGRRIWMPPTDCSELWMECVVMTSTP